MELYPVKFHFSENKPIIFIWEEKHLVYWLPFILKVTNQWRNVYAFNKSNLKRVEKRPNSSVEIFLRK